MNNYQNMREHFNKIYGVRGGTKIYQRWLDWRKWTAWQEPQAPIKITGKQMAVVITSPTEFRVEIVGVNP